MYNDDDTNYADCVKILNIYNISKDSPLRKIDEDMLLDMILDSTPLLYEGISPQTLLQGLEGLAQETLDLDQRLAAGSIPKDSAFHKLAKPIQLALVKEADQRVVALDSDEFDEQANLMYDEMMLRKIVELTKQYGGQEMPSLSPVDDLIPPKKKLTLLN